MSHYGHFWPSNYSNFGVCCSVLGCFITIISGCLINAVWGRFTPFWGGCAQPKLVGFRLSVLGHFLGILGWLFLVVLGRFPVFCWVFLRPFWGVSLRFRVFHRGHFAAISGISGDLFLRPFWAISAHFGMFLYSHF